MEDPWIGKVLFIGIAAAFIWGVTALLGAKGETARRARIVIGGAIALIAAWVWFLMTGPAGLLIGLGIIGAVTWVVRGAKK